MKNIKYIPNKSNSTHIHSVNGVDYITFDKLDKAGVVHAFSTRTGGVSEGYLGSMNLSFHRGDDPDKVMENHRRFAKAVGIVRISDIIGIDGLMTNVPGIPLMTFYADCVPIYFYDPVRKVVAMNHSGWKGTVAKISQCMIKRLGDEYGTDPTDLICAIGPSICKDCYEVSEDVAEQFKLAYTEQEACEIVYPRESQYKGKYLLDLHTANYFNLVDAGVKPENIDVTNICTCCNPDWLFSHRASKGLRGNLGAVIMLPE